MIHKRVIDGALEEKIRIREKTLGIYLETFVQAIQEQGMKKAVYNGVKYCTGIHLAFNGNHKDTYPVTGQAIMTDSSSGIHRPRKPMPWYLRVL